MRLHLRGQLILTFLLSVVVALGSIALITFGLLTFLLAGENRDLVDTLSRTAAVQERAQAIGEALAEGGDIAALQRAAAMSDLPSGARTLAMSLDGAVWYDSGGRAGGTVTPEEVMRWLTAGQTMAEGFVLSEPIWLDGRLWGYYVYLPSAANHMGPVEQGSPGAVREIAGYAMLLGQAFALLVCLLLFWNLGVRLVKPIQRLSDVVRRIANGDLSARTSLDRRGDELGQLAADVDRMAERLEEARRRVKAAEAARRYTVAAISHDLRTPLTAVLAHAEAVQTGVSEDPERSLEVIREKGLQMKGLIDDLFELASLDADGGPWQAVPTDVAEVLRRSVVAVLPALEAAGMTVEPDIPDQPLVADLAPGKLERVLDNLLGNALKYGASGGWLGVRAEARHDGWVHIEVADRGPGIPPEEQRHIFDPFYRADRARSGVMRGSGLGLAVARRIVERLGGRIGVVSPPGGGARFWVELPARHM